jgi:hypothetical protein
VPIVQDVFYGDQAISLMNPSTFTTLGQFKRNPPDLARVTWTVKATGGKSPYNPLPPVGPKGFVVTVSTFEAPMSLHYSRVAANPGKERKEGEEGKSQQRREYGLVLDSAGTPIHLYGGADMVAMLGSPAAYNDSFKPDGTLKDGKGFVFGRVDPNSNEAIPLESLKADDGTYFFQRTFLVDSSQTWAQWASSQYSIALKLEDMPHRGQLQVQSDNTVQIKDLGVGGTYYVRVAACSEAVGKGTASPRWQLNDNIVQALVSKSSDPFRVSFEAGLSSVGPFSQARRITFPNASTADYLTALKAALLVLFLSRSDLPLLDELIARRDPRLVEQAMGNTNIVTGVVAKYTGLEASKKLIGLLFPDPTVLTTPGVDPIKFRTLLRRRVEQLAQDIYTKVGPIPEVEAAVVESTPNLRAASWRTILAGQGTIPLVASQGQDLGEAKILDLVSDTTNTLGTSRVYVLQLAAGPDLAAYTAVYRGWRYFGNTRTIAALKEAA